jgi:hypothetical protein
MKIEPLQLFKNDEFFSDLSMMDSYFYKFVLKNSRFSTSGVSHF